MPVKPDRSTRLQKVLADRGVCSRREADRWIQDGSVKVNGVVAQPGKKVDPLHDQIVVKGKGLPPHVVPDSLTLMVNKPKGLICSHGDPRHSQTIFDLLSRQHARHRLICAGRLDKPSEGLVVLTSDGDLANRIMHPSNGVMKRYRVQLNRPFPTSRIPELLRGKEIDGEFLKAEKVVPQPRKTDATTRLEVHLLHGRKREIRRLFESLGFFVKKLKRFQIGRLVLRGLAPGSYRRLTLSEIDSLFG